MSNKLACGAKAVWMGWEAWTDCSRVAGVVVAISEGVDSESGEGKGFVAVEEGGAAGASSVAMEVEGPSPAVGPASEAVESAGVALIMGEDGACVTVAPVAGGAVDAVADADSEAGPESGAEMRLQFGAPIASGCSVLVVASVTG